MKYQNLYCVCVCVQLTLLLSHSPSIHRGSFLYFLIPFICNVYCLYVHIECLCNRLFCILGLYMHRAVLRVGGIYV